MAQYKNSGLDSKALAEKKSKRLEEALSAYTPEQTKQTVDRLLEEFVDEGGENYFGAGNRDTTLYFADDDYIREIEKEKAKEKAKAVHKEDKAKPKKNKRNESSNAEKSVPDEQIEVSSPKNENDADIPKEDKADEVNAKTVHKDNEEVKAEKTPQQDKQYEEKSSAPDGEEEQIPAPEPTIVITPVKEEVSEKEDTEEMRREFFDDEVEVEAVPKRRRKKSEAPQEEKNVPEVKSEDDYEDDYEEDEKKNKFGNFFKRRSKDDPFDDEFDDEFDDDYYDDDDYDDYEEGGTFKKILNVVVIIALICSTAFFAASNYTNSKKLQSANTQINELNNGTSSSSQDEISQLKAKIDELTAENERLKSGGSVTSPNSEPTSVSSPAAGSTTITGTAPSDGTQPQASGSTYTIKAGDTGSKICKAVYGQYTEELWNKILSANGMTASSVYHPGDVLQIPNN